MDITQLVSDVGFPIVITFFLMHRMERKLDQVVMALQNLSN
ncbi:YvrJ family protein [Nosocomiicoccus sp. HMSC09A07]|nr:YvrJ family protein [Nosocomiicoccus sp. HMSC09A07]